MAYVVGEPAIDAAIALEESGAGHTHADEPAPGAAEEPAETEVPRSLQSTVGLLTATAVAGTTLGGLVGVLSALALGRFGRLGVRGSTLLVTGIGFVSLYAVPFVAYPPNPPAVGSAETIGTRTMLYFTLVAISVVAAVAAVLVGRRLAARWGAWYAGLAGVGGYLLVVLVAIAAAPQLRRGAGRLPGHGAVRVPDRQLRHPAHLVGRPRGRPGRARAPSGACARPRRAEPTRSWPRCRPDVISPPSAPARAAAAERLDALAKPLGALGRLEDLARLGGRLPGRLPAASAGPDPGGDPGRRPRSLPRRRLRLPPGGDRGHGAGLRRRGGGRQLPGPAARRGLRVLDLGVDDDLADLPAEVSTYHIGPSQPIHRQDALTAAECRQALRAGRAIAETEIAAGADLLILGDMGIGNTTPAAALIAATFGVGAEQVVGRGTGIDDERLTHKTAVVAPALDRMGDRVADPMARLAGLGSADLAAGVGFLCTAARRGVPVLLDGIVSVAEVAVAEELEPGVIGWCAAGHRSTEPAQQLALDKLGLEPDARSRSAVGRGHRGSRRGAGAAVGGVAADRDGPAVRSDLGGIANDDGARRTAAGGGDA